MSFKEKQTSFQGLILNAERILEMQEVLKLEENKWETEAWSGSDN